MRGGERGGCEGGGGGERGHRGGPRAKEREEVDSTGPVLCKHPWSLAANAARQQGILTGTRRFTAWSSALVQPQKRSAALRYAPHLAHHTAQPTISRYEAAACARVSAYAAASAADTSASSFLRLLCIAIASAFSL